MSFWKKLTSCCGELSPNCREAARAQSESLERPLPPARRLGLCLHLLICKWCRRYGKQISLMHHASHDHQEDMTRSTPEKLSEDARKRIKEQLRKQ